MARPKKYEQGAERITLSLSPETKVVVEAFCRWYSFTRDKTLGIGETLIEVLKTSRAFEEFARTRPDAYLGFDGHMTLTVPVVTQLPLFEAPAPKARPDAPGPAVEARPSPAVEVEAVAPPVEARPAAETPAPPPVGSQDPPDEAAVLKMVRDRRDAPVGAENVRAIAKDAGVDATMLYKALKGERHLTFEARSRLAKYLTSI